MGRCTPGEARCAGEQGYACRYDDEEGLGYWLPTANLNCPLASETECAALVAELTELEQADNPCASADDCYLLGGTDEACGGAVVVPPFAFSQTLPDGVKERVEVLFQALDQGGCRIELLPDESPTLVECAAGKCGTTSENCLAGFDEPEAGVPSSDSAALVIVDFESWDGVTPLPEWTFEFGPETMRSTGGASELSDGTGAYLLQMVLGREGSEFALSASNSATADFGGGVLLWLDETDVTPHQGLSFWVRGSAPAGTLGVVLHGIFGFR
jgi:hypothetical protein